MRQDIVFRAEDALERAGYRILRCFTACFDLVASGRKRFLVKALHNIDGFRPEHASEMKRFSCCVGAEPIIVGERTKHSVLGNGVVYERFGISSVSPDSFEEYALDGSCFPVYSRGRSIVSFDSGQLREVRESRGLSLSQMAEVLGVTKESVYLYERGVLRMRAEVAERVWEEFGEDVVRSAGSLVQEEESKLEKELSFRIASLDFRVSEFERAGFDIVARDERNRVILKEGVPKDPSRLSDLSCFFESSLAFVSEKKDKDLPVVSKEDLDSVSSKKEFLSLLK